MVANVRPAATAPGSRTVARTASGVVRALRCHVPGPVHWCSGPRAGTRTRMRTASYRPCRHRRSVFELEPNRRASAAKLRVDHLTNFVLLDQLAANRSAPRRCLSLRLARSGHRSLAPGCPSAPLPMPSPECVAHDSPSPRWDEPLVRPALSAAHHRSGARLFVGDPLTRSHRCRFRLNSFYDSLRLR
jgi:hypothetical protein